MWMCDRCQEINDDNVTVCPKYGFVNEPSQQAQAASHSAPPNLAGVKDYTGRADTDLNPTRVRSRILNRWQESGIAIKKCPALILVLIVLLVVEALPVFTQGIAALIADILSALILGRCILKIWKLAYLRQHGIRTVGTVADVQTRAGSGGQFNSGPWCSATVEYEVSGVIQRAVDRYGQQCRLYPSAGDQMTLFYDPAIPNFAEVEPPVTSRGAVIFAGFIFGIALYAFAWNVYVVWNGVRPHP